MFERITAYDMHNDPKSAWNTFSDEIKALHNDMYMMCRNNTMVGEIPEDIKASLLSLASEIPYWVNFSSTVKD